MKMVLGHAKQDKAHTHHQQLHQVINSVVNLQIPMDHIAATAQGVPGDMMD